jgi:ABC-type transport system substrate-binding protein
MRSIRGRNLARRVRAALTVLALGVLFGSVSGCREPYPQPRLQGAGHREPVRGGIFRYAFDSDIRSLDPHVAYDELSGAVVHMLFDTLVDYAPGTTELTPSLAERWEISPDGLQYTFHLREGVRFHNGRAMTAEDVRLSFERMLDPQRVPCPGTSFYHLIDGFEDFQEHRAAHLRGLEVLDARTVRFRLTQPDQTFLNALALPFAAPIPVEVADALGRDRFGQQPSGTGPFELERWETGSRVVLRRNSHYWQAGRPYLDGIVVETGIARYLQFMRFQRGDLDHVHTASLSTADYMWVHEQPAWRPYVIDRPDISMYALSMNTEKPPWNNVHLRRAVAFAIDREAMARSRNYRIRPLGGIYPPGMPGYDEHLPGAHHYDLARARQEMALAGYANGLPGEHELWVTEGEAGAAYGQLIQADLARIGIHIRLRQASFAVFLATTQRRGAVEMTLSAWSQDYPDPSNFIETLFHSRNIQDENAQNVSFYRNPRLDELLDRARIEPDHERRLEMYREAERIVVADAPWAFMYTVVRTEVNQPYVRGYQMNPVFAHDFRNVWLDLPVRPFTSGGRSR